MIVRIIGELKVIHTFKCSRCEVSAIGQTDYVSIDALSVDDAIETLSASNPRPSRMPMGWSSYQEDGNILFKCPACKEVRV